MRPFRHPRLFHDPLLLWLTYIQAGLTTCWNSYLTQKLGEVSLQKILLIRKIKLREITALTVSLEAFRKAIKLWLFNPMENIIPIKAKLYTIMNVTIVHQSNRRFDYWKSMIYWKQLFIISFMTFFSIQQWIPLWWKRAELEYTQNWSHEVGSGTAPDPHGHQDSLHPYLPTKRGQKAHKSPRKS